MLEWQPIFYRNGAPDRSGLLSPLSCAIFIYITAFCNILILYILIKCHRFYLHCIFVFLFWGSDKAAEKISPSSLPVAYAGFFNGGGGFSEVTS